MPTVDVGVCEQIRCGAMTQQQAGIDTLMACSTAGYAGSRNCSDPVCKPYIPQIIAAKTGQSLQCQVQVPAMPTDSKPIYVPSPQTPAAKLPSATVMTMPKIVPTAQGVAKVQGQLQSSAVLNPKALLNPLPQIVPPAIGEASPQVCDSFTAWVSANPLLAGIGLIAAFMLVTSGKR